MTCLCKSDAGQGPYRLKAVSQHWSAQKMGRSKRIAAHIATSILAVVLIALYGWQADWFLHYHVSIAVDWGSNREVAELQRRLVIPFLAGALVRLPYFVNRWLRLRSSHTAQGKPRRLRIDWRLLLTQGLPAILLMGFPSYFFLIGQAIWGDPFYLLPSEVTFNFMGCSELKSNGLAAFWLGGTLVDSLEFPDYRTSDK